MAGWPSSPAVERGSDAPSRFGSPRTARASPCSTSGRRRAEQTLELAGGDGHRPRLRRERQLGRRRHVRPHRGGARTGEHPRQQRGRDRPRSPASHYPAGRTAARRGSRRRSDDATRCAGSPHRRRVAAHARHPPGRHLLLHARRRTFDGSARTRRDREHVLHLRPRGLYGAPALLRGEGGHPRVHEGGGQGADRPGRSASTRWLPATSGRRHFRARSARSAEHSPHRRPPAGLPSPKRSPALSHSSPPTTPATSSAPC